MNDLIDEQELRDAMQPLRIDPLAFEASVRRKLEEITLQKAESTIRFSDSPWLEVAASMVPLSLLSKTTGSSVIVPFGKASLGYKLVGYAALPVLSILVMLGATLLAVFRIRKAQLSPQSDSPDAAQQQSAILIKWWTGLGLIPSGFSFIALVVFLMGYTFPVFIFFAVSGIAMVTLISRLGHAGLLDRQSVGGVLISSLMSMAGISHIYNIFNSGCHLLDQQFVMMILWLAAIFLGMLLTFDKSPGLHTVAMMTVQISAAVLVFGFFGQSIWNPMNTERMKHYVESFDKARFSSVTWQSWAVPTAWLRESGVKLDLSKPRALLESEIAGEQNPFILGVASRTGLLEPDDFSRIRDPFQRRKRLLDRYAHDQSISSIEQVEFAIRELVRLNQWTPGELDLLESRLLATIRDAMTSKYGGLDEALIATESLQAIGRPCSNDPSIRQQMQQTIVAMQRTGVRLGGRNGGFAKYHSSPQSDLLTTSTAIELMEHYGVPPELNLIAIRSFLRPEMVDSFRSDLAAVRAATKMRFENLPQVPPLTFWDYIRHEPSILMALVFAALCFFATLGCPYRPQIDHIAKPAF